MADSNMGYPKIELNMRDNLEGSTGIGLAWVSSVGTGRLFCVIFLGTGVEPPMSLQSRKAWQCRRSSARLGDIPLLIRLLNSFGHRSSHSEWSA